MLERQAPEQRPTKLIRDFWCAILVQVTLLAVIRMPKHIFFRTNRAVELAPSNNANDACFFLPAIRLSCPDLPEAVHALAAEIVRAFINRVNRSNRRFWVASFADSMCDARSGGPALRGTAQAGRRALILSLLRESPFAVAKQGSE